MRKIIFIFITFFSLFTSMLKADKAWVGGLQYSNFRDSLELLFDNYTEVILQENQDKKKEFFIKNEKHFAVKIEFYNQYGKKFSEHIATPSTATFMTNYQDLLESPLKVNYKSFFDNTFTSSLTSTGIIESDLPEYGHIRIILGDRKAMIVTAFSMFSSSIDIVLSSAELASGKSVKGIKSYIQYIFFYNAIRNPELMTSCATILSNLNEKSTKVEIKYAFIQIKNEYMKYLDGNFKTILGQYLYKILDFKTTDAMDKSIKLALDRIKIITLLDKFGKNVLVPMSSIYADMSKGRRVIATQLFGNPNIKKYPKIAEDIPINYALNEKLFFFANYDVPTVFNLYDKDGNYNKFNPQKPINTKDFINMIIEAYNRTHLYGTKLSADIFFPLSDKLYVEGSATKFKETILLKDAIAIFYYLFEHSYGIEFKKGKIYRKGTMKTYSHILFKYFTKNHYKKIKDKYASFYLAKTRLIYMIYGNALFRDSSELSNKLTKAKAINIIHDYMKYHATRKKGN